LTGGFLPTWLVFRFTLKDLRNIALITFAFAAVTAGMGVYGVRTWDSGGTSYFVAAIFVGAGGLEVIGCYVIWVYLRTRMRGAGIVAGSILGLTVLGGIVWTTVDNLGEAACVDGHGFFRDLAAADPTARAALIADGGKFITQPTECGLDGVVNYFSAERVAVEGATAPVPEAERLETLKQLFSAGFPADRQTIGRFVRIGDVTGLRVVLAARSPGVEFPVYAAGHAAIYARCNGDGAAADRGQNKYDDVLRLLVAEMPPPPLKRESRLGKTLICLGLME
jgi:hypothetical protein